MTDSTLGTLTPLAGQSIKLNGISLVGSGSATPSQRVNNDKLSERVDTSDSWIRTRTGIQERRISTPGESVSILAQRSAHAAIEMAGWAPQDVDLIVLATSTPDDLFGSAPKLQADLGASNAVAFDLTAACSGFLFALISAAQFLRTGEMTRALVIGADQLSRWVNWDDRSTCVLFGDGAGAVALESTSVDQDGLLGFKLKSDGLRGQCLTLKQFEEPLPLIDGSSYQRGGFAPIQMNGKEVFKFAAREVPLILQELLSSSSMEASCLDWLLLHQANQRILDAVADRFAIPHQKVLSNLASYGNTSAATIPLMLDEAVRGGLVKPGHLIATSGFGAGLSWGAALLRWHGPA